MSSSPWERFWNGDEDVATPFTSSTSPHLPSRQAAPGILAFLAQTEARTYAVRRHRIC